MTALSCRPLPPPPPFAPNCSLVSHPLSQRNEWQDLALHDYGSHVVRVVLVTLAGGGVPADVVRSRSSRAYQVRFTAMCAFSALLVSVQSCVQPHVRCSMRASFRGFAFSLYCGMLVSVNFLACLSAHTCAFMSPDALWAHAERARGLGGEVEVEGGGRGRSSGGPGLARVGPRSSNIDAC